jgi:hypothetical protein
MFPESHQTFPEFVVIRTHLGILKLFFAADEYSSVAIVHSFTFGSSLPSLICQSGDGMENIPRALINQVVEYSGIREYTQDLDQLGGGFRNVLKILTGGNILKRRTNQVMD